MFELIEITNFKSIKKSSVKLPPFGAIVGRNAAGKTNLIQAIQFLKDLAVGKTTIEAQRAISLIPNELFNFSEVSKEFGIEIILSTPNEKRYLICVKIGLVNGSIKPPILVVNEERFYRLINEHREEIYFRDKEGLKDSHGNLIPISVDINKLALAVYKTPDTDAVKEVFMKTVIPDVEKINDFESSPIGNIELEYENLASIIVTLHHNHPEKYENFQTIIKKLLPNYSSIVEIPSKTGGVDSPEKESYLVVLEERNLKQILSMQSVSTGDLKTIFLIATTLSMEDYSTLIVEEIENGMHPKRITDLMEHLETITKIKHMQTLFTTHSPAVINRLSPQEIVLTGRDSNLGTQYALLNETDQITKIKNYLQEGGSLTDYLYPIKY